MTSYSCVSRAIINLLVEIRYKTIGLLRIGTIIVVRDESTFFIFSNIVVKALCIQMKKFCVISVIDCKNLQLHKSYQVVY